MIQTGEEPLMTMPTMRHSRHCEALGGGGLGWRGREGMVTSSAGGGGSSNNVQDMGPQVSEVA